MTRMNSPNNTSLYCYPWDVTDVDRFVDQARSLGMNGATLAVSYHAGKFLRPHASSGPRVVFPEDGVVYFEPDMARYGDIKPQAHSDPALREVLPKLVANGGVAVHAWTVLLHNSRLGAAHPQYTARNAYGDGYLYSLCPMQQPVFDYAVALSADVAARGVASVVVETPGWLPYAHGYHHEFAQVRSNLWLDSMLGLCFCDACMAAGQAADIDMDGLRQRVRRHIDSYLDAPVDATPAQAAAWVSADLLEDRALAALNRLRQDRVTQLVAAIRAAMPAQVQLSVVATVQRPTAQSWLEGTDLHALSKVADWLEIPFYEADAAAVRSDAWDCIRRIGTPDRIRAILRPGPPDLGDGAQLPQALQGLWELGIRHIGFYNYGMLRRDLLQALGAALHSFDRRSTT
ncbi:hypothetical protein Jab_2c10040 [Janthinobacterium sp. HH01]|nr:hypothetical protein Jab_2c10040 [Janthinobacterium sp. HH01]